MKEYKITEEQIQGLANVLGEIPAKISLPGIDLLRSLPLIAVETPTEGEPDAV